MKIFMAIISLMVLRRVQNITSSLIHGKYISLLGCMDEGEFFAIVYQDVSLPDPYNVMYLNPTHVKPHIISPPPFIFSLYTI